MKMLLFYLLIAYSVNPCLSWAMPADTAQTWRQEFKQIRRDWRRAHSQTEYAAVLKPLLGLRPRMPHIWQLDYMIGIAACNGRDAVCNPSFYLRNSYNHSPEAYKGKIFDAYQQCSQPGGSVGDMLLTSISLDQIFGQAGSLGVFKMGNVERVSAEQNAVLTVSDSISEDMYEDRLFERPDSLKLATTMKSVSIFAKTSVYFSPHFAVSADSSVDAYEMNRMTYNLERAYAFFQRNYGFQVPDHLIAAYYLNSREWRNSYTGSGGFMQYVSVLARKKDKIIVPKGIIGYNNPNDLSIIGFAEGTLFHELMHLMLYVNFADAPAWFAEGLPALYEVSTFTNDNVLKGETSWRSRFLVADGKLQATPLDTLFRLNNDLFNVPTYANAVHVATARYFCLFLQNRHQLSAVYKTLQALPIGQLTDTSATVSAIETAVGLPLVDLQREFEVFLRKNTSLTPSGSEANQRIRKN